MGLTPVEPRTGYYRGRDDNVVIIQEEERAGVRFAEEILLM